ncbi:hypothetical protein HGRIS_009088 [Hohenbuehelia grisea]|uniref:Conidiation-specific protein 6 n=1 Tax=Hohenbuehelia grisea TaxID=104357 RepID=A0ABR3J084_9AGAR
MNYGAFPTSSPSVTNSSPNKSYFIMSGTIDGKNAGNVIGGYKATLSNPNSSEEAKEHAQQKVDDLTEEFGDTGSSDAGKNKGNVIGGHKANLKNPNTSEEAKDHSRQVLQENDALPEDQ